MGVIGWIVLGGIAGWLASLTNGTDRNHGWIGNIILGIVGAMVGGFLFNLATGSDNAIHFSIGSLIIAVIGALIVSYLYSILIGRRGV
ncbi:MAG: GlsB/YeaQ/YmgE family stress response membrane protein [Thermomicrobiales bacterium]